MAGNDVLLALTWDPPALGAWMNKVALLAARSTGMQCHPSEVAVADGLLESELSAGATAEEAAAPWTLDASTDGR